MKIRWKIVLPALLALMASFPVKAERFPGDLQTGSASLDRALNRITAEGRTWPELLDVSYDITDKFALSQELIARLVELDYDYGEIYLIGLLHDQASVPVESVVALLNKGMSWREVVAKVGMTPQAVNRARIETIARSQDHLVKDRKLASESATIRTYDTLYSEGVPSYLQRAADRDRSTQSKISAKRAIMKAER